MNPETSPAQPVPDASPRGQQAFLKKLAALQRYKDEHGDCLVPSRPKSFASLSSWASRVRRLKSQGRLPREQEEMLNNLGFEWNHDEGCWQRMRRQLANFVQAQGHCLPPPAGETTKLAHWVYAQRALRQAGRLSEARVASLDELGFQWSALDARWWKMQQALAAHRAEHGSCNFSWDDNSPLARWSRVQRREQRSNRLPSDRLQALNALGFSWDPRPAGENWRRRYEELQAFARTHGHCNVPINYQPNRQLGLWVFHQRQFHKKGTLSAERMHLLESIGFSWSVRSDAWERNFEMFREFVKTNGHARISAEYRRLAAWAYDQRVAHRRGTLSPERRRRLAELGFRWSVRSR